MKEHFRGVVWPHGEAAPGLHKYIVVGIIVTDEMIDVGSSTNYLDGETHGGILPLLATASEYKPPLRFGDASNVLLTLGKCRPSEDTRCSRTR